MSSKRKLLNEATPGLKMAGLGHILNAASMLLSRVNTVLLASAGLAIKAGSSAIVKAASAIIANVNGVLVRKAANTDMPALVGTLATAKSAAWPFYIDGSGTLTTGAKTADAASHDAALALVPIVPLGLAQIGILLLDNATGSNFVGGTTALDVGSLTATYYNTPGPVVMANDPLLTALYSLDAQA